MLKKMAKGRYNLEATKIVKIKKVKDGIVDTADEEVVVEYDLTIFINGRYFITLLCTPKNLDELVWGYLFSEGVLISNEDLLRMSIDEEKKRADVHIAKEDIFTYSGDQLFGEMTVTTACGKGRKVTYPIVRKGADKEIKTVDIEPEKILSLVNKFNRHSDIFDKTGGVHSCGLCDESEMIIFRDDIGRHNAMEKILGRAMMDGIDLSEKIVLTTGRVSSEIIEKIILRGIPILVSRSAPTSAAIELAKRAGVKLIGFARGNRMNIYA
jgi:FdhD protein